MIFDDFIDPLPKLHNYENETSMNRIIKGTRQSLGAAHRRGFSSAAPKNSINFALAATGIASLSAFAFLNPLHAESLSEKAGKALETVKQKSPLSNTAGGLPVEASTQNANTSMNHGGGAGSPAERKNQKDPIAAAQKSKQAKGGDKIPANAARKENSPSDTGPKIESGHEEDADGQRVPKPDSIKPNKPQKSGYGGPPLDERESSDSKKEDTSKKASVTSSSKAESTKDDITPAIQKKSEQAKSEEAYDEETGEINWDCPCLGGMAHGPCGDEFKAAFSCFVHSKADPKGAECLDDFKGMQDCFRKHPEIYV